MIRFNLTTYKDKKKLVLCINLATPSAVLLEEVVLQPTWKSSRSTLQCISEEYYCDVIYMVCTYVL